MFERFTERARWVVVKAQDEARALRHNHIGTEHVLLGLLAVEDGLAARVLEGFGVDADTLRAKTAELGNPSEKEVVGQIPFTPRSKKVLELSLREALSLGHNYIGTEHLLLGLVREDEGLASRFLDDAGADAQAVREEIIRRLSRPGGRPSGSRVFRARPGWEYQVERHAELTSEGLDARGREGWELVTVQPLAEGFQLTFKRPR